ncbi:sugar transporter [Purpureocillium lavendulum]|uniref:Sugar transporter n=1 Tax=Purpureocillium lavendulum TaxID=1247861 RepID=A0AB34FIT9_9HYPO|nr:sugar transporter [Purpureocillium lavendulum]
MLLPGWRLPSSRGTSLLLIVLIFIFAAVYPAFFLYRRYDEYVYQQAMYVRPLSTKEPVEQNFTPTAQELACLQGKPFPTDEKQRLAIASKSEPIPSIVHFIFLQRLPIATKGQGDFDFVNYLSVRSAITSLKPKKIVFHYAYTSSDPSLLESHRGDPLIENNPWLRRLRRHLELVRITEGLDNHLVHAAHLADTLRLEIILAQGGIYLDTDVFVLRPFTKVLASPSPHDLVLGHEGGNRWGLCNAVIAARPNSTFVRRWLDTYKGADLNKEWNYHSVILPKELSGQHPDEICPLPPDAFFWPTWTDDHVRWMHEKIDRAEARHWEHKIWRTGGGLFDNQLAYHAWNHVSKDKYLERLTPQVIREEDTRFNLLMRRFLEADV